MLTFPRNGTGGTCRFYRPQSRIILHTVCLLNRCTHGICTTVPFPTRSYTYVGGSPHHREARWLAKDFRGPGTRSRPPAILRISVLHHTDPHGKKKKSDEQNCYVGEQKRYITRHSVRTYRVTWALRWSSKHTHQYTGKKRGKRRSFLPEVVRIVRIVRIVRMVRTVRMRNRPEWWHFWANKKLYILCSRSCLFGSSIPPLSGI